MKLTGPVIPGKLLYPQIIPAMTKCVFTAIAWDTSESTVSFIPVPHAFAMLQTTFKIIAHSTVISTLPVPCPPHLLHLTDPIPLLDLSVLYHPFWWTGSPPLLPNIPSEDLITHILPRHVSTSPLFDSVMSILLPQALMIMTSMTPMLGGISMAVEVFQWCFNVIMGVML